MNHSEAIQSQAAAAYLLDKLDGDDRIDFEMHYIDCPICAEAVYRGTMAEKPLPLPIPFPRRVQQSLSIAAAAAIAFVLGGRIPAEAIPMIEIATPAASMSGATRGDKPPIVVHFEGDRPAEIVMTTFSADARYVAYELEIQDASRKVLKTFDLSRKAALHENGVSLLLRALPAGRYVVLTRGVLRDGNRAELDRQSVVVQ
jgi:hypothetical protein